MEIIIEKHIERRGFDERGRVVTTPLKFPEYSVAVKDGKYSSVATDYTVFEAYRTALRRYRKAIKWDKEYGNGT